MLQSPPDDVDLLISPAVDPDAPAESLVDGGWDPQLARTLYKILYWVDLGSDALRAELAKLEEQYQDAVYAELIFMLSHLRFSGAEAREHWSNVGRHQQAMESRMRCRIDIRVALVSYFLDVNRSFRNPKLIEMRVFEQTRASAYWDQLTGLRNYRYFSEHLSQELLRSKITGAPTSLVMIDVDDFKAFNDTYGHEAGNETLARVARLLPQSLRESDVAARYGGEEFALVLNALPKAEAWQVAERVRVSVERAVAEPSRRRVTVSLGIATYPADAGDAADLVRHADRALYEAKFAGKNQVRLFRQSTRSYVRVEAALSGLFATQALEWSALTTLKISQGGLQFRTAQHLVERSLLEFQLDLPGESIPLSAVGRVVRVSGTVPDGFDVAVQFLEVSQSDRARLDAHLDERNPRVCGNASQRSDHGSQPPHTT